MEDKEVGELWTELQYRFSGNNGWLFDKSRSLIRKLVEERATYHWTRLAQRPQGTNPREVLSVTLEQFGIEPETWKEL